MKATLFVGGPILPMTGQERTEALLVIDQHVARCGSESDLRRDLPLRCQIHDLDGAVLLPAFVDAHVHLLHSGLSRLQLDLAGAASLVDIADQVARRAAQSPAGAWIMGGNWDESHLAEHRYVRREDLDRVAPGQPVLLHRICGHMAVANAVALAQVDLGTLSAERRASVLASGLLLESEVGLVARQAPRPDGLKRRALQEVLAELTRLGVTRVGEFTGAPADLSLIEPLGAPVAVRAYVNVAPGQGLGEAIRPLGRYGKAALAGVKVFADGSLGAHTAALSAPYADQSDYSGSPQWTPADLAALIQDAQNNLLQVAVHAIGDAAIEISIQAFEQADAVSPIFPFRHRIEHALLARADQIRRARDLGLTFCMQPNFTANWGHPGGLYSERLGQRARSANPLGSVLAHGPRLAFGSDGMPLGPLYGIAAALAHPDPGERLRLDQALLAATAGAAHALFEDGRAGRLQPGLEADLAIVDQRLFTDPAGARVLATYRAGEPVHVVE